MNNLYLEKILRSPENEGNSNGQTSSPTNQGDGQTTPREQVPLRPEYNGQAPNAPNAPNINDRPVSLPRNVAPLNLGVNNKGNSR